MAKTKFNNYGVIMNSVCTMRFNRYLNNSPIKMNTISPIERRKIAQDWLNNYNKELLNAENHEKLQ